MQNSLYYYNLCAAQASYTALSATLKQVSLLSLI